MKWVIEMALGRTHEGGSSKNFNHIFNFVFEGKAVCWTVRAEILLTLLTFYFQSQYLENPVIHQTRKYRKTKNNGVWIMINALTVFPFIASWHICTELRWSLVNVQYGQQDRITHHLMPVNWQFLTTDFIRVWRLKISIFCLKTVDLNLVHLVFLYFWHNLKHKSFNIKDL